MLAPLVCAQLLLVTADQVLAAGPDQRLRRIIEHGQKLLARSEKEGREGRAEVANGSMDAAERKFREALKLQPGYPVAMNSLLEVLVQKGDAAAAFKVMEDGVSFRTWERERVHPLVELKLGQRLYIARRMDEALNHLRSAVQLSPTSTEAMSAMYTMGQIHEAKAKQHGIAGFAWPKTVDARKAFDAYRKAIALHRYVDHGPLTESHYNLGLLYTQTNKLSSAARHLRAAIELQPTHVTARMHLVNVLRWQNNMTGAETVAAEGVALGLWERTDQTPSRYTHGIKSAPWPNASTYEGMQAAIRHLESSYDDIRQEVMPLLANPSKSGLASGLSEDFMAIKGGIAKHGWHGKALDFQLSRLDMPRTCAAVDEAGRLAGGVRLAQIVRLEPGTVIRPHCGEMNSRWVVHLGLELSENVTIEVAGERRPFVKKKCLLFDDSFVHSVKNNGDRDRITMVFHFPNLAFEEHEKLKRRHQRKQEL